MCESTGVEGDRLTVSVLPARRSEKLETNHWAEQLISFHLLYKWPSVVRAGGETPQHYMLWNEDVAEGARSGSSSGGMAAPQGSMPRFSPSDVKSCC